MASTSDALVGQLLEGRYVAALATQNPNGSIHMVAVWYWFDGTNIFVATSSRSRKARNLQASAKVSLMIDSRVAAASYGVNIAGDGQIIAGESSKKLNIKIHNKYLSAAAMADSKVGPVFAVWDDVTIQITPKSVITWDMRQLDQQALGGAIQKNPTYMLPLER
ncbi:MAG: pyridoxamine 5'-phosphate oxidase family protein [Acidobacteriaceae bacterium]|nr:pyridoxamine 5'-phosphate oxidase family protein [Acidobacteriaceae bacterium]